MVSVIDKDFDMEGENSRVSNDVNANEEIRVSSGFDLGMSKTDFDEVRVLKEEEGEGKVSGRYHANGDVGEVKEGRILSKNDVDGEIVVIGKKFESRNLESGENEVGEPEIPGISGVEKPRGVETVEIGMGNPVASGSGRKGMSNLSSKGGEDGEGETEAREKGVHKVERLNMDRRDVDFKLERRGDLGAVGKKLFGIDINGSVMKTVSAKVLGTEFEMGDMVWGKVKSHPWWPGHLFNEAFASTSVRRTRSDGHILVAFFGDSSYGWFDPDELVPYDPHYAEKSQQTTSRNFVRAVEESVDEASRRSALGLSCYCRNPYNFRPTDVPGYLSVDIIDFEPGTVYSVSQIQKARDSFSPTETLSFIQQLATAPMSGDRSKSLDFIKLKSTALAYRRSIFEEFDETYAEAFGHKPVRPKLPPGSTVKEPSRAPLSGPLVFADNLGGRKSSTKPMKSKDQSKKDRYLFKRRDESGTLRSAKIQGPASPDSSCEDVTPDLATSSYVFQKRDQPVSSNDLGESPAVDQLETLGYTVTPEDTDTTGHILSSSLQHSKSEASDVRIVPNKTIGVIPSSSEAGNIDASSGLLKKKKKGTKRPVSELSFEKPEPKEKMKKKSKKTEKIKNTEHPERDSDVLSGVSRVSPVGRPTQIVSSPRDDTQVDRSKKYVPQEVGLVPLTGNWETEADIQQILADLHGLALDPLHGIERNGPAIARHFILNFRSLVFLKGSSGSAMAEPEHGEAQLSESPGNEVAYRLPTESSKTKSSLKPSKVSARQDDSAKVGRKRVPSERQEENAAKRVKKIADVKTLGAEKRALLKNPELQQPDGKSRVSTTKSPQSRPSKPERPTRVEEPTYLIMKYQTGSSLPSLVELKARFARFGPLDTALSRVFYRTNTCRVAFLFKQDANIAYRYAVGNKSMFSNVRFMLKPVAGPDTPSEPVLNPNPSSTEPRLAPIPVLPQSARQLKSILKKPSVGDEASGPSNGGGGMRTPRVRFNIGDEKGSGSTKGGVPQVQMMESRNPVLSSNEGAVSSSSSSFSSTIAMDVNKNQRLLSQRPLEAPLLPLPHFVGPPVNNNRPLQVEMGPITNIHENFTSTTTTSSPTGVSQVLPQPLPPPPPPPAPPSTDISQQMMSLLTKCHDVVTNLKSTLGYIPFPSHSQ